MAGRPRGNTNHLELAAIGEAAVRNWAERRGLGVEDVRKQRRYMLRDIDYVLSDGSWLEVKTDAWAAKTGNLFFELVRDHGGPGCFYRSKADNWAYLVVAEDGAAADMYVFALSAAQSWLAMHADQAEITSTRSHRGHEWVSYVGAKVPLAAFFADVAHEKVHVAL